MFASLFCASKLYAVVAGSRNDSDQQHTPQTRDGLHPAVIALIVVSILFPVIAGAAVAFWCYM